jgi:hypothetical protein
MKMTPPPMNPIPVTICAATREGSTIYATALQNVEETILGYERDQSSAESHDGIGA